MGPNPFRILVFSEPVLEHEELLHVLGEVYIGLWKETIIHFTFGLVDADCKSLCTKFFCAVYYLGIGIGIETAKIGKIDNRF